MVLVLIEAAMYGIGMYGCTALYGIGEVHRRRRAQRMRSKTSNTAIDLCPLPPFTMIHTSPSDQFHWKFWTQLAVNARLEVNVPRLGLEFGGGLFPMQIFRCVGLP